MRWLIVGLVGLAFVGCGGGSDEQSPEDAVEARFEMFSKGQHGPEWELLHPAQQALVPKDLYVQCSAAIDTPDFEAKATESYEETVTIPGTDQRAESVAVTVEVSSSGAKETWTVHVFDVDGTWRWALDPEPYKAGKCPS